MSALTEAYRYWRRIGHTAALALHCARGDVAMKKTRYSSRGSTYTPQRERGMYWIEPASTLRFVGYADEIMRMRHRGWYVDTFQDDVTRGVVYLLPHSRYVAGYSDPWGNDGVTLDLSGTFDDKVDAAFAADRLAEISAEHSREYDEAWQAGRQYEDLADTISSARQSALKLIREIKAHGRFTDGICAALRDKLESLREEISEAREKRADLWNNWHSQPGFSDA